MELTREILKNCGFTNCETSYATRNLGMEYWYLGEDNYIENSELLVTMFDGGGFQVRYKDNVACGLHTVEELRSALKLFKCNHLVCITKPKKRVVVTCYDKTKIMDREAAMKLYLDYMRNSEGSEHERYSRIYEQLESGRNVCTDEC